MKTSWFKTMAAACVVSLASLGAFGAESITLTTSNHYPWDGKVDCQTTLSGLTSGETYYGVFSLTAGGETKVYTNENLKADGTYTTPINCTELFGTSVCTTGAGITVKLYKKGKARTGVQLWKDGPFFATTNIGGENPQDYGYYFWWGDTIGYKRNATNTGWISSKDGSEFKFSFAAAVTYEMTNKQLADEGYIVSESNPTLTDKKDAAHQHWGSTWRMMTDAELQKLVDTSVCTATRTTSYKGTGVKGWIVTGKTSGYTTHEIFLPASGSGYSSSLYNTGNFGYYWTSTPHSTSSTTSQNLTSSTSSFSRPSAGYERVYGVSIRPVYSNGQTPSAGPDTEAASASGTFDVDTRATKTTTLAGAEIVGGETILTLNYSPNAWGKGLGTSVDVTYVNENMGTGGTIVEGKTTEGSVDWTPPAEAGTYRMDHSSDDGTILTTYFTVVVNTAKVVPVRADNTDIEGVYTNGFKVAESTTEKDTYIVKKGANVTVKFQGYPGYFFKEGDNYLPTKDVVAENVQADIEVPCPEGPVQGTSCGGGVYGFLNSGAMTMVGSGAATSMPFGKYSITSVKIGDGVTSLGANYFKGCANIVTVTGGKDLAKGTGLGSEAFYLCMSLETISLACTEDPGVAGAVKYVQAFVQGTGWKMIPTVSMPGYVEMVYGKDKLEDAEWTQIGPLSEHPSMYEIEGYHFFEIRLVKEVK